VLAGYPWFSDWGRDTMIALPGLLLRTGRAQEAARVLRTFAGFVDQGMLPNRFPKAHHPPEYNTVDATLWYFVAVQRTLRALPQEQARELGAELLPVLEDIVADHLRGTRYGIGVDSDGLLTSGQEGVQLTWMDARVEGRVITPRQGKPVEVNGLWIHALQVLLELRQAQGQGQDQGSLEAQLQRARQAFERYWDRDTGCLKDVLDVPGGGNDATVRPNQIIALSLESCPLSQDRRRQALQVAGRALLTSHGLRSLSPEDDRYAGSYSGPPAQRDERYHQGTTWGWLIGPWVRARLLVQDSPDAVRRDLDSLLDHLGSALVGSASEIFDGDPPFKPRGAPAQAWSVASLLDALDAVHQATSQS
jgi:predicted glycogen debranching enzyme